MSLPEITPASNSFQILSHQSYHCHHHHHHRCRRHDHHDSFKKYLRTLSLKDFLLATLLRSWPESPLHDQIDDYDAQFVDDYDYIDEQFVNHVHENNICNNYHPN